MTWKKDLHWNKLYGVPDGFPLSCDLLRTVRLPKRNWSWNCYIILCLGWRWCESKRPFAICWAMIYKHISGDAIVFTIKIEDDHDLRYDSTPTIYVYSRLSMLTSQLNAAHRGVCHFVSSKINHDWGGGARLKGACCAL